MSAKLESESEHSESAIRYLKEVIEQIRSKELRVDTIITETDPIDVSTSEDTWRILKSSSRWRFNMEYTILPPPRKPKPGEVWKHLHFGQVALIADHGDGTFHVLSLEDMSATQVGKTYLKEYIRDFDLSFGAITADGKAQ